MAPAVPTAPAAAVLPPADSSALPALLWKQLPLPHPQLGHTVLTGAGDEGPTGPHALRVLS